MNGCVARLSGITAFRFCLAASAAAAALFVAGGEARANTANACQTLKLRAVGDYYSCLLRAGNDQIRRARCGRGFERMFGLADQNDPNCPPLDDFGRTQRAVDDQAQAVLIGDVSLPPCQAIVPGSDGLVTCRCASGPKHREPRRRAQRHHHPARPPDCTACAKVTTTTPMWIQAWGGTGGDPRDSVTGPSGYAQMVTSIGQLNGKGILDLYFYLGSAGGNGGGITGGAGGAATLVTKSDLLASPSTEPASALLIAGGGGGGGGRDDSCVPGSSPGGVRRHWRACDQSPRPGRAAIGSGRPRRRQRQQGRRAGCRRCRRRRRWGHQWPRRQGRVWW